MEGDLYPVTFCRVRGIGPAVCYYKYMKYIFSEPDSYGFKDVNGHNGKFFGAESPLTSHLIIECEDKLTVSLVQHKSEFTYYILESSGGYFTINDQRQPVTPGDLVVLPPNTKYTFGGKLRMFLINTPRYTPDQEEIIKE